MVFRFPSSGTVLFERKLPGTRTRYGAFARDCKKRVWTERTDIAFKLHFLSFGHWTDGQDTAQRKSVVALPAMSANGDAERS
jgi:hypothetical protein